jgi:hypothetical protein
VIARTAARSRLPLEEAKGQLKQRLEQMRVERHIAELRTKATVK